MDKAWRFSEAEIMARMDDFPLLEADFMVVPPGTANVPFVEQYTRDNPAPEQTQVIHDLERSPDVSDGARWSMADTTIMQGLPVKSDGMPCKDITATSPATSHAEQADTSKAYRQDGTIDHAGRSSSPTKHVPQHAAEETFGQRLRTAANKILRRPGRLAFVAALSVGVGTYVLLPDEISAEKPVIVPATPTQPDKGTQIKGGAVLSSVTLLRQTGTCAVEATAMADYLDRQQSRGVDMSRAYPTAQEYRSAALEAANRVPCTGTNTDSAVVVRGERVSGDSLLAYMFDLGRLCDITNRMDVQHDVVDQPKGAVYDTHMQNITALFKAADKAC